MTTGKIDYSPDYRSEKRKPLNSRVKISARGRPYLDRKEAVRRMLDRAPDSPPEDIAALARIEQSEAIGAERARLEREVVEAAKAEYEVERTSDRGANTITRTDALIKLQPLMQKRREAVAKLVEFESLQEKNG